MKNLLVIQVILDGIRSLKDRTWKITWETSELTPEDTGFLNKALQKYCTVAIKMGDDLFKEESLDLIAKYDGGFKKKRTQAQQLRDVLYRFWEQNPKGYKDSEDFYKHETNRIIEHYKRKLK